MALKSTSQEMNRRSRWMQTFSEAVRRQASDPYHQPVWPDAQYLYLDGWNAEQAATAYLEAHHLGENA